MGSDCTISTEQKAEQRGCGTVEPPAQEQAAAWNKKQGSCLPCACVPLPGASWERARPEVGSHIAPGVRRVLHLN